MTLCEPSNANRRLSHRGLSVEPAFACYHHIGIAYDILKARFAKYKLDARHKVGVQESLECVS